MLKFIIITICVLWLLSKIMKYAFRFLLIFTGRQMQKEMEKQVKYHQQQQAQQEASTTSNGTRIIYTNSKSKNSSSKDDGEYVDYEEVE